MPLQKNQLLTLRIERLSNDGSGVAHSSEGEAVFVPGTAPGDEAQVRIVKDCGRYAFGILDKLLTPSPDRIPVDCAVAGPCGGCSLRHLDYAAELRAKQESVADAFRRIGGLDVPVLDALPSPEVDRYRNKVQFPVGRDKDGAPCIGFYAGRTHRIVPCPDCKLQPGVLNDIGNTLCAFFAAHGIQPYDEERGKGLVRHIFLRRGAHSGQIMVCLVCTRPKLPHSDELVALLREKFRDIATILINVNAKKTNVILGEESVTLYGPGFIEDTLCGVPVRLGPLSFYQVNTLAAERLYGVAAEYAQLEPDDVLLDLYCGMGTIGLSMANHCRELIGVEIIPEAIDSAKANAARMGDAVAAKSRFFCADAGEAAARLAAEGLRPDVIMLDPPRKGCDETTLSAVVQMSPRRVVYVSCNPSTAARDAAWLGQHGYRAEKVQPVDLFPRTKHVEAVLLLTKLNVERHIEVDVSMDELDAPNGMWTYFVSVYYMANRDSNGFLDDDCFYGFLNKITAFIWAYAVTNPGVNALRTPIFAEMINLVNRQPVQFTDYLFHTQQLQNAFNNYVFSNNRAITKAMLTWWAFQNSHQELLSLESVLEIEHIYARSRQEKEHSLSNPRNIESLGNKVLLEKRINIRASDYRFSDKVKYYTGFENNRKQKKEGTKIKELTDLAANATDFTESDIVERNAKIILNFITFMHNNDLLCED